LDGFGATRRRAGFAPAPFCRSAGAEDAHRGMAAVPASKAEFLDDGMTARRPGGMLRPQRMMGRRRAVRTATVAAPFVVPWLLRRIGSSCLHLSCWSLAARARLWLGSERRTTRRVICVLEQMKLTAALRRALPCVRRLNRRHSICTAPPSQSGRCYHHRCRWLYELRVQLYFADDGWSKIISSLATDSSSFSA